MKDECRKKRPAPGRDSTAAFGVETHRRSELASAARRTFSGVEKTPPPHQSQREAHRPRQLVRCATKRTSVREVGAQKNQVSGLGASQHRAVAAFGRTPQPISHYRGRSAERICIRHKTHFRRDVLARREGELAFVPRARPSRRRQAPRHPPKVRLIRRRACCCTTAPATHRGW